MLNHTIAALLQIPKFVSRAAVGVMHKLADLQNFAVYWDCNAPLIGQLSGASLEVHLYVYIVK